MASINKMKDNGKTENKRKRHCELPEQLPPINSLKDLISLGGRKHRHQNINMDSLWEIMPHLQELDNMIGMETVKTSVFKQVIYYLQELHHKDIDGEYLHTQIIGPPGTGKTTVAKLIGRIFRDLGILSEDSEMRVVHRDDFVAGYVGQTALKTKRLLNNSIGGVLFLDEAYAMGSDDHEHGDTFAKEAIDTITSFLSEHKDDFCFIVAGYEEDMKKYFFSLNKGLERRFPWKHKIEAYNPEELTLIVMKKIHDINWQCDVKPEIIKALIEQNKEYFKNSGGDIENFVSKCKIAHATRVFTLSQASKFILTEEDINEGLKMVKANSHEVILNDTFLTMYS